MEKQPQGPVQCRFYGRFVVVEREINGLLTMTIILPNMTFGDSGLREHKALLTIPRHFVAHKKTTLLPTFRTMTDGDAQKAEDFIWDLTGWSIDVGGEGGVSVTPDTGKEMVDLAELERIQGRKATLKANLQPSLDGFVRAAISVGGGVGTSRAAFHTPPCTFISLADAKSPNPVPRRPSSFQVDIVDITLPNTTELRLTLRNGNGEPHYIALTGKSTPEIAFSNLCNELPHVVDVDLEFAQYYHLLETVAPDRLVPKVVPFAGDEDCNRQARIRV